MSNIKILIVDDELIMRESLAGWLERDGHAVQTAASGEEEQKMRCYREKNTGFRLGGQRICVPIEDD